MWQANPNPKQVVDPAVASVAEQHPAEGRAVRDGHRCEHRAAADRQDRDEPELRGRLVRRAPSRNSSPRSGWGSRRARSRWYGAAFTRITVFGGTWPAQIWRLFMEKAAATFPVRSFPHSGRGLRGGRGRRDPGTYCLPNQFTLPQNIQTLEFIAGTEPTRTCTEPTSLQSIPVPSVVGLSQAAAMTILGDAGFYVKVVLAVSTQPPGTVISQSPSAGVSAYQTSSVLITVSKDDSRRRAASGSARRDPSRDGGVCRPPRSATHARVATRIPTRGRCDDERARHGRLPPIQRSLPRTRSVPSQRSVDAERLTQLARVLSRVREPSSARDVHASPRALRSARRREGAPPSPLPHGP